MYNTEFVKAMPSAAMQLNNTDMVIFGGEKTTTFKFDTRDVQGTQKIANVKTAREELQTVGRFGKGSDYVARTFKNFIYAIDAGQKTLQVYQIKEQVWHKQSLSELGIVD